MLRKTISTIVASCVLIGSGCAGAAGFSSVVSYSPQSGEITVAGDGASKGNIVVMVIPETSVPKELGENELPVAIRPFSVEDGKYSFTLGLPEATPGGKYTVYVSQNDNEITQNIVHMNVAAAQKVIPLLNESDGEEFDKLLVENAVNLGVDVEDEGYIAESENIFRLLDRMEFEDMYDFYDKYSFAYAICMIAGEENTDAVDTLLFKYASVLGIDYEKDFRSDLRLTPDKSAELLSMLASTDFETEAESEGGIDFKSIFEGLKPLAAVRCVNNWVGLREVITGTFKDAFKEMISSDSHYERIKDKDSVFAKMMDYKFNTLGDVEAAFENASDDVYADENRSSSGGNSGGGSKKGGSFAPVITTPPASELINDDETCNDKAFSDFESNHWAYPAVMALSSDSVINGYEDGTFRPDCFITRAEFTKMILSYAKELPVSEVPQFEDVAPSDWFYESVCEAASKGIINGTGSGFNPNANIKREDAALIVYRVLNLVGKAPVGYRPFGDRKEISKYAEDAVFTLGGAYILNGDEDNRFHPQNSITRAEAAQLIYNAFKK